MRSHTTKSFKIRQKNRDPIPVYSTMDERRTDRDSDLGDDSPMVSESIYAFLFSQHFSIAIRKFGNFTICYLMEKMMYLFQAHH